MEMEWGESKTILVTFDQWFTGHALTIRRTESAPEIEQKRGCCERVNA